MIEYVNFVLLSILLISLFYFYFVLKKYLSLIKMAKTVIENSLISYDIPGEPPPPSDGKRQKLLECVLTGKSKLYLGKMYTKEQINKLKDEEVEKLFSIYEAKLSCQMVESLGKSLIRIYSMGACAILGINDQEALINDLENDPFLNSSLQRLTCNLYYRFGSLLGPLSVGLNTGRRYINERRLKKSDDNINTVDNKNVRRTDSHSSDNEEP